MKFIDQKDYPHWLFVTRTDLEEEQWSKAKLPPSDPPAAVSVLP